MSRPRLRRQAAKPAPRQPIRLLLLPDARDAEAEPRPALAIPGQRLPTIFPTVAAALAAKRAMEGGADA
jgi:hypothetical protein